MNKTPNSQIKADIRKFLGSNGIMTLATHSPKGSWACTVYYGVDEDMNLYIVTDPKSIHGKNMVKDHKIAFNVFDSHQKIYQFKKGLQGAGTIEQIRNVSEIVKALRLWHKQNPGIEKKITLEKIRKVADTKVFKITPRYFRFFNETLYPQDESVTLEL